jgi:hypothetical protein
MADSTARQSPSYTTHRVRSAGPCTDGQAGTNQRVRHDTSIVSPMLSSSERSRAFETDSTPQRQVLC